VARPRGPRRALARARGPTGLNRRVHWLIEVKTSDDEVGIGLKYYTAKRRPEESFQLVLDLPRARDQAGIKIRPFAQWFEGLAAAGDGSPR
jgi:hypothetical protein